MKDLTIKEIMKKLKCIFQRIKKLELAVNQGGGIQSLSGDFVDNTDPSNPILDKGYTMYKAVLNQSGTNAPVPTVFTNDTGATLTWNYLGVGQYELVSDIPIFLAGKTFIFTGAATDGDAGTLKFSFRMIRINDTTLSGSALASDNLVLNNGILVDTPILIEIHP